MKPGDTHQKDFSFSQEQVNAFAEISGDKNPIHIDAEYAAETVYKKPIIHGFLGGSVISNVLGTEFPGEGTVYLKQEMTFRRPMYPDVAYRVILTVLEVDERRNRAEIETKIVSVEDGKPVLTGSASVMHKERI
ncbi:MAG: MaoC family dehydratase [Bacteroidetes bacterium]|nr:MaoC family dehydratase [Bacteroidota bacterium]MCB0846038.1 MaoC family dehydratase [Bacteroidota bacterium]